MEKNPRSGDRGEGPPDRVPPRSGRLIEMSLTLAQHLLMMVSLLWGCATKFLRLALLVLYLFWTLLRQTGQLTVRL